MTSDTLRIAALALVCIGVLFLFIGIWWMFLTLRESIYHMKLKLDNVDDKIDHMKLKLDNVDDKIDDVYNKEDRILGLKDDILDFVLDKVDGVTVAIKDESEEEE